MCQLQQLFVVGEVYCWWYNQERVVELRWMYLSPILSKIGLACLCKRSDLPRSVWASLLCTLIGWIASRDLSVLIRQLRQVSIWYTCVTDILHEYKHCHVFIVSGTIKVPLPNKRLVSLRIAERLIKLNMNMNTWVCSLGVPQTARSLEYRGKFNIINPTAKPLTASI